MGQANAGHLVLTIDEATAAWLSAALPVDDLVVLDVDDGVGRFTQGGLCRAGCRYQLLAVKPVRLRGTPYAPLLKTPLGQWYLRPDQQARFIHHPRFTEQGAKLILQDDTGILATDLVLRVLEG